MRRFVFWLLALLLVTFGVAGSGLAYGDDTDDASNGGHAITGKTYIDDGVKPWETDCGGIGAALWDGAAQVLTCHALHALAGTVDDIATYTSGPTTTDLFAAPGSSPNLVSGGKSAPVTGAAAVGWLAPYAASFTISIIIYLIITMVNVARAVKAKGAMGEASPRDWLVGHGIKSLWFFPLMSFMPSLLGAAAKVSESLAQQFMGQASSQFSASLLSSFDRLMPQGSAGFGETAWVLLIVLIASLVGVLVTIVMMVLFIMSNEMLVILACCLPIVWALDFMPGMSGLRKKVMSTIIAVLLVKPLFWFVMWAGGSVIGTYTTSLTMLVVATVVLLISIVALPLALPSLLGLLLGEGAGALATMGAGAALGMVRSVGSRATAGIGSAARIGGAKVAGSSPKWAANLSRHTGVLSDNLKDAAGQIPGSGVMDRLQRGTLKTMAGATGAAPKLVNGAGKLTSGVLTVGGALAGGQRPYPSDWSKPGKDGDTTAAGGSGRRFTPTPPKTASSAGSSSSQPRPAPPAPYVRKWGPSKGEPPQPLFISPPVPKQVVPSPVIQPTIWAGAGPQPVVVQPVVQPQPVVQQPRQQPAAPIEPASRESERGPGRGAGQSRDDV
jgi:hypothetical protein